MFPKTLGRDAVRLGSRSSVISTESDNAIFLFRKLYESRQAGAFVDTGLGGRDAFSGSSMGFGWVGAFDLRKTESSKLLLASPDHIFAFKSARASCLEGETPFEADSLSEE